MLLAKAFEPVCHEQCLHLLQVRTVIEAESGLAAKVIPSGFNVTVPASAGLLTVMLSVVADTPLGSLHKGQQYVSCIAQSFNDASTGLTFSFWYHIASLHCAQLHMQSTWLQKQQLARLNSLFLYLRSF